MPEINVYNATELNADEWRKLQAVEREAYLIALPNRSQAQISTLVDWDDPDRFYNSHIDPNSEVGGRYNENQSYYTPKVAVATDYKEPVGFAYSAHNTSGENSFIRNFKRIGVKKNYLWLREIAVKPDFQRQGIAKHLGRALLKDAINLQPVAAYIWPEEIEFLQAALEKVGFSATGEQEVRVFGENSEPIRQVRMQAPTVSEVLKNLTS